MQAGCSCSEGKEARGRPAQASPCSIPAAVQLLWPQEKRDWQFSLPWQQPAQSLGQRVSWVCIDKVLGSDGAIWTPLGALGKPCLQEAVGLPCKVVVGASAVTCVPCLEYPEHLAKPQHQCLLEIMN